MKKPLPLTDHTKHPFKIIVGRKALHAILSTLKPAVDPRTSTWLLKCVRIDAKAGPLGLGSLTFTCTTGEIVAQREMQAVVAKEGSACVPYAALVRFLSVMPDEDVALEIDGDGLKVSTHTIERVFKDALGSEEFPALVAPEGAAVYEMPWEVFARIVRLSSRNMSRDGHRRILCGMFFSGSGDIVATDAHRLSCVKAEPGTASFLMMDETVRALVAAKPGPDARLRLFAREGFISAEICWEDAARFSQVAIPGQYPNYQRVIPDGHTKSYRLDAALLNGAIVRCMTVAGDNANRCRLNFKDTECTLSARSEESGNFSERVPMVAQMSTDPFEIAVNGHYMLDYLASVAGADWIELRGTESSRPSTFHAEDYDDFTFVVMPMALA